MTNLVPGTKLVIVNLTTISMKKLFLKKSRIFNNFVVYIIYCSKNIEFKGVSYVYP